MASIAGSIKTEYAEEPNAGAIDRATKNARNTLNQVREINERLSVIRQRVFGESEGKQAENPNVPTPVRCSLDELQDTLSSLSLAVQGIADQVCSIENL